jgi:hypothetical protein
VLSTWDVNLNSLLGGLVGELACNYRVNHGIMLMRDMPSSRIMTVFSQIASLKLKSIASVLADFIFYLRFLFSASIQLLEVFCILHGAFLSVLLWRLYVLGGQNAIISILSRSRSNSSRPLDWARRPVVVEMDTHEPPWWDCS